MDKALRQRQKGASFVGVLVAAGLLGFIALAVSMSITQSVDEHQNTQLRHAFEEVHGQLQETIAAGIKKVIGNTTSCSRMGSRLRAQFDQGNGFDLRYRITPFTRGMPKEISEACTGLVGHPGPNYRFCLALTSDKKDHFLAKHDVVSAQAIQLWDATKGDLMDCNPFLPSLQRAVRLIMATYWRPKGLSSTSFQSHKSHQVIMIPR